MSFLFNIRKTHLLVIFLCLFSSYTFFLLQELHPKVDTLWLHFTGYELIDPTYVQNEIIDKNTLSDYEVLELSRRDVAKWNYPSNLFFSYLTVESSSQIFVSIALNFFLTFLVFIALFTFFINKIENIFPFLFFIFFYISTMNLKGPEFSDHLLIYESSVENIINFFALLINPGRAFSPLSIQPKSFVFLFLIVALLMKLEKKQVLTYLCLACGLLFHISLTLSIICIFIAADVLKVIFKDKLIKIKDVDLITVLFFLAGLCAFSAYLVLRTEEVWDESSPLIQLSSRLFFVTFMILILRCSVLMWAWCAKNITSNQATRVPIMVSIFGMFLASYLTVGLAWEKRNVLPTAFTIEEAQKYESLSVIYMKALIDIRN